MRLKKTIAVLSLAVFSVSTANARFIDSWLQQYSVTNPYFFQSQQRGYFGLGSFSARWQTGSDYLFSIQPPRIRAGCGGIDIFLGSFSFLNFEYLVQKLQRMIQAAPAIAFDLALKALFPQLSEIIKSFESIIDQLNALQLDECRESRAIVARILDGIGKTNDEIRQIAHSSPIVNAIVDGWRQARERIESNDDKAITNINQDEVLKKCTEDVKQTLKTLFPRNGSVIYSILRAKTSWYAEDLAEMIRGMIGDVEIWEKDGQIVAIPIKACDQKPYSLRDLIDGKIEVRPLPSNLQESSVAASTCVPVAGEQIKYFVNRNVMRIYRKVKENPRTARLDDQDIKFINAIPVPLYSIIRADVVGKHDGALVVSSLDVISAFFAYRFFIDVYKALDSTIGQARTVFAGLKNQDREKCHINVYEGVVRELEDLRKKAYEQISIISDGLSAEANKYLQVITLAKRYEEFGKIVEQQISRILYATITPKTK